ncbi:MAG: hypothetical protein GY852_04560, partial [bacterium]|nr:hypothetical protein [bacterium]
MVGILILLVIAAVQPFNWECPTSVNLGDTFSLRIVSTEPGCSGISLRQIPSSSGIAFQSSSTSTSISSVSTPQGRQLTQVIELNLIFRAEDEGVQTIGPFDLNCGGVGTFTLDEISIDVNSSGRIRSTGTQPSAVVPPIAEDVWLKGILRETNGRIYPGTRLFIDYYVYANVNVNNVTYWWGAPELGVIRHVETIPDSNWESSPEKHENSTRSLLAEVEMSPAAAGSLLAPAFWADITGTDYDRWGKIAEWTIESEPILLAVYPFPENPPAIWDGLLLDSVHIGVEQLPSPPGQGGELSVRVSCLGPGNIYMEQPPDLTIRGNANLIPAGNGSARNKKWWDFILEPSETGMCILGPDSAIWLDRRTGTYRTAFIESCSLEVTVIP